jgi:hypothetical protein
VQGGASVCDLDALFAAFDGGDGTVAYTQPRKAHDPANRPPSSGARRREAPPPRKNKLALSKSAATFSYEPLGAGGEQLMASRKAALLTTALTLTRRAAGIFNLCTQLDYSQAGLLTRHQWRKCLRLAAIGASVDHIDALFDALRSSEEDDFERRLNYRELPARLQRWVCSAPTAPASQQQSAQQSSAALPQQPQPPPPRLPPPMSSAFMPLQLGDVVRAESSVVLAGHHAFRALPEAAANGACVEHDCAAFTVPAGWRPVSQADPDFEAVRAMIVGEHSWSTDALAVADDAHAGFVSYQGRLARSISQPGGGEEHEDASEWVRTLGGGRFQVTAGFGRMLIRKQLVAPPAPGGLRRSRSHAPATRALHCGVAPRRGKRPAWKTLALPLRHAEPWDATPPPGGGALEMGGSMYEHRRHAGGASVFQLSMPFLPPLDLPIL